MTAPKELSHEEAMNLLTEVFLKATELSERLRPFIEAEKKKPKPGEPGWVCPSVLIFD